MINVRGEGWDADLQPSVGASSPRGEEGSWRGREAERGEVERMSWFGSGASMEDVSNRLQRQQMQGEGGDAGGGEAREQQPVQGVVVAPGVRFSEKLWARLGGQLQDGEQQKRREKLSNVTAFPELPSSLFDSTFRRDAVWKQRELRLRKGYVEHLESMSLQKKDDQGTLQDKVLEQVTGVYKLAEDEAMERLSKQTMDLAQRANRLRPSEAPCKPERKDVIDCYGSNSKNPLACAGLVSAMEACAVQARKDAMQRIKPASA